MKMGCTGMSVAFQSHHLSAGPSDLFEVEAGEKRQLIAGV